MIFYVRDTYNNFHLKNGLKENVNYKVIPHEAWKILNLRYGVDTLGESARMELGPLDYTKLSVPVPTADPLKPDYIVETS